MIQCSITDKEISNLLNLESSDQTNTPREIILLKARLRIIR